MTYIVNKTNGSVLTVINDHGVLDTTTDLTLIGKNYAGYGEFLNENFIALLENFANSAAPSKPLTGELWYDTTNTTMKVWSGSVWTVTSGVVSDATAPSSPSVGDLWFDTVVQQLKVYNGTVFIVVGPQYKNGVISGPIVEIIADDMANDHVVTSIYIENVRFAIISRDTTFTPGTAIAGFATISAGYNLSTVVTRARFNGIATDSDSLGTISAANYLRSNINDSTTGQLSINNDNGMLLGTGSDLALSISSGSTVNFKNVTNNADIIFGINMSGTPTNSITIDGATNTTTIHGNLVVSGTGGGGNIINLETDVSGRLPIANIVKGNTTPSNTNFLRGDGTWVTPTTASGTPSDITITTNNATNETVYLTFVDGSSGTQGLEVDTSLSYNPSTNILNTTTTAARYA